MAGGWGTPEPVRGSQERPQRRGRGGEGESAENNGPQGGDDRPQPASRPARGCGIADLKRHWRTSRQWHPRDDLARRRPEQRTAGRRKAAQRRTEPRLRRPRPAGPWPALGTSLIAAWHPGGESGPLASVHNREAPQAAMPSRIRSVLFRQRKSMPPARPDPATRLPAASTGRRTGPIPMRARS